MIYFIQSGDFVKVGYTSNMKSRYKKYITENPNPVKLIGKMNGGYDTEKKIHKLFKEFHHRGEWFKYDEEVRTKIFEIIKEHRDHIEPTKAKVKRQKRTYLNTLEGLREYATGDGMLFILPHIKEKICSDNEISQSTFARHLTKLLKLKKLSRIDNIYYIT